MTVRDGLFYLGLMSGLIAGGTIGRFAGWPWIAGIILGAVIGLPLGWFLQTLAPGKKQ